MCVCVCLSVYERNGNTTNQNEMKTWDQNVGV